MKFMQVHTFYTRYLEDYYKINIGLSDKSFQDQTDQLLADGFSASHLFAPYMSKYGYETQLVIANNGPAQAKWLFENGLALNNVENWLYEVVIQQVSHFKPDILYLTDPISFDARFLNQLPYKPKVVFGWRAASIPTTTDWRGFDLILSNHLPSLEKAHDLGAKGSEFFMPGFPTPIALQLKDEQKEYDVVFAGQLSQEHTRRCAVLNEVAEFPLKYGRPLSLGYFIGDFLKSDPRPSAGRYSRGVVWGMDMFRAIAKGKIALNAHIDIAKGQSGNMRLFETTGVGAFMLTDYEEDLYRYFEPGREVETYRNEYELAEKIYYYLDHPEQREEIARRGQERCLRDYSMEKRAEELDSILSRYLSMKGFMNKATVNPAIKLKAQATKLIASGEIGEAFNMLVEAKALKQPLEGLDLLRAHCFIKTNQLLGAIEALREELRWFPDNSDAARLLEELQQLPLGNPSGALGDAEFQHVVATIRPYTMLSEQRLFSLYSLAKSICERNIPGNFVECGVAAGGSSALLAYVIKRHSRQPRRLFSFDSFSGMPVPTAEDTHGGVGADASGWGTGTCSAPEESVREICAKLGVSDVLTTIKGYFEETLPVWRDRVGMISLLHLDGDWYESTRAILVNLYNRVSNDGILQVDDYGHWEGCRKAIHEFEADRHVTFDRTRIDGTGVWFSKPDKFARNPAIPDAMVAEFNEIDPIPKGLEGQMSPNERFQLYYLLSELLPKRSTPLRFVEVGSFAGGSLALTYCTLKKLVSRVEVISVDPGQHPSLLAVIGAIGPEATYIPMYSHQAVECLRTMFSDGNLPAFMLIDGDHSYEGVRQDIIDYYPLLAPGGIILLHDWLPPLTEENREAILAHHGGSEPGIRQACTEVLEGMYGLTPLELPVLYPTDPTQTQPYLPIIPGVFSTIRAYRKQG